MGTKEAIKIIEKAGWKVHKINKNLYQINYEGEYKKVDARGLIKFARVHSSDSKQKTAFKGRLKWSHNYKARASIKQAINNKRYDDIPPKGYIKNGNPWDYD